MTRRALPCDLLLPLLLSLPSGVVAGVSTAAAAGPIRLDDRLGAFGPGVDTPEALRHAAARPPVRLVVKVDSIPGPLIEAALTSLRRAGVTVVLHGGDPGRLLRWCDRLLDLSGAWIPVAGLGGTRCLALRIAARAGEGSSWVRVALDGGECAEGALAAARAQGLRVLESRIAYRMEGAR